MIKNLHKKVYKFDPKGFITNQLVFMSAQGIFMFYYRNQFVWYKPRSNGCFIILVILTLNLNKLIILKIFGTIDQILTVYIFE